MLLPLGLVSAVLWSIVTAAPAPTATPLDFTASRGPAQPPQPSDHPSVETISASELSTAGPIASPSSLPHYECPDVTHHFRHQLLWIAASETSGCMAMETTHTTIYRLNQLAHKNPGGYKKGDTFICNLSENRCAWRHNPLEASKRTAKGHSKRAEAQQAEPVQALEHRLFDIEHKWSVDGNKDKANMPPEIVEQVKGLICQIDRMNAGRGAATSARRDGGHHDLGWAPPATVESLKEKLLDLEHRWAGKKMPSAVVDVVDIVQGLHCRLERILNDPGDMKKRDLPEAAVDHNTGALGHNTKPIVPVNPEHDPFVQPELSALRKPEPSTPGKPSSWLEYGSEYPTTHHHQYHEYDDNKNCNDSPPSKQPAAYTC